MLSFWKSNFLPIGIDLGSAYIKMAQLACDESGISVIAAAKEEKPADVETGTGQWQHWAIKVIRQMLIQGAFKGRKVVTALPADEVFIDEVKVQCTEEEKLREAVLEKVQPRLGFDPTNALLQFVSTGTAGTEQEVLVMATERTKVDRHLAIYEQANLEVESIAVWPVSMISAYTNFFGRRQSDKESTVMLLELGANFAKVVICRHSKLIFARLVPIGITQLQSQEMIKKFVFEVGACARFCDSAMHLHIDRLIFLTGQATERTICEAVVSLAKGLQVSAQIGDVLAAIHVAGQDNEKAVERRGCRVNWTASFGLGLSNLN